MEIVTQILFKFKDRGAKREEKKGHSSMVLTNTTNRLQFDQQQKVKQLSKCHHLATGQTLYHKTTLQNQNL